MKKEGALLSAAVVSAQVAQKLVGRRKPKDLRLRTKRIAHTRRLGRVGRSSMGPAAILVPFAPKEISSLSLAISHVCLMGQTCLWLGFMYVCPDVCPMSVPCLSHVCPMSVPMCVPPQFLNKMAGFHSFPRAASSHDIPDSLLSQGFLMCVPTSGTSLGRQQVCRAPGWAGHIARCGFVGF